MIKLFKKTGTKIFILALLARAVFFAAGLYYGEATFSPSINEDSGQYVALAHNMLAGRGFTRDVAPAHTPEYFRTLGYPAFLAVTFAVYDHLWFAVLVQMIISAFSVVLLFNLSKRFISGRWAIAPPVLMAFEPATLYWTAQILTETLFTFVLLAGVTLLFKYKDTLKPKIAVFAGLVFGALMMIRPSGTILFPLIAIFMLVAAVKNWKRSIFSVVIFLATIWMVMLPWQIRNKKVFNAFEFSPVGNIVGFGKNLSWYTYLVRGLSFAQAYPELDAIKDGNPFVYGHALQKATISSFLGDPLPYMRMTAGSFIPFFFGDGWNTAFYFLKGQIQPAQTKWLGGITELVLHPLRYGTNGALFWVGKLFWAFIILLAVFGYILEMRKKDLEKRIDLTFLVLIVLLFAISSGVTSYSRFRQPVNPYIFIFSALGLEVCRRLLRRKQNG